MNHAASSAHTVSQGGTAHSANHQTKEWIISTGGGRGRETATGNNGDADRRRARTRGRTQPTALATRLARAAGRHARVARPPAVRRLGAAARLRVHARDPVAALVRAGCLVPRRRVEAVRRDPLVLVRNVSVHAWRGVAGSSRGSIGPWVVVMDRRGSSRIAMGRRGRGEGREVRSSRSGSQSRRGCQCRGSWSWSRSGSRGGNASARRAAVGHDGSATSRGRCHDDAQRGHTTPIDRRDSAADGTRSKPRHAPRTVEAAIGTAVAPRDDAGLRTRHHHHHHRHHHHRHHHHHPPRRRRPSETRQRAASGTHARSCFLTLRANPLQSNHRSRA